jgi:uncharacterized protein
MDKRSVSAKFETVNMKKANAGFILLLLFVFATMCFAQQASPVDKPEQAQIIDMHCHAAGGGFGGSGCFISKSMRESFKFKTYLKGFGVTLEDLQAQGDGLIIKKISEQLHASQYVKAAVVLAMDGAVGPDGSLDMQATEIYIPNEFVRDEVKKYDNLYYGASINPYRKDAIARLRQAAADGAVLVKWIPSIMLIEPADARLIPFYKEMARLGMPLLTHTGYEATFTKARNDYADPLWLEVPLKLGVTVIAAHMASTGKTQGEENMARLTRLMHRYPGLYGDISSLTQINRYGALDRALKDPQLHSHLLYGSDFPLINTVLCQPWMQVRKIGTHAAERMRRLPNPWDRDVELKKALGVPEQVFTNARNVISLHKGVMDQNEKTHSN